ncbi:MAG: c-type cytochrome, partial [Steroidobacteraceae bacterium]
MTQEIVDAVRDIEREKGIESGALVAALEDALLAALAVVAAAALLSGCEKGMQDMYQQPRYNPLAPSRLWADGGSARLPVPGTQIAARGGFAGSSSGREGYDLAQRWDRDEYATVNPYPLTAALLARGQQRFQIYCAPCHGPAGDGNGYIV